MNRVRARAYGVDKGDTGSYPAFTSTDQAELRKGVRIERRMEFAFEGLRYMDLICWRLAEKALLSNIYGILDAGDAREKLTSKGLWFWPETPSIDEDGLADFTAIFNDGFCKILADRDFNAPTQYLWPIPAKELLINENLKPQNPGY